MRFIHTSDWHLGRLFHGVHLTEDQSIVLEQLLDLVRDVRPDFMVIAGDLYDRAVPPPEAVELLDEVFCRLVLDLKVPVVAIAGNHDSPQRLEFGSRLLRRHGLHLYGTLSDRVGCVEFKDNDGPVRVYVLPYAEPAYVRQCLGNEDIRTHDAAMRELVGQICNGTGPEGTAPAGGRSILVAHAFVAGGTSSDSERPLSVGGSGCVDGACFDGFSYAALGHLHFPHAVGREELRYSGSLMKYSFGESGHRKCVNVVEMDAKGACRVEAVELKPRRDVRRLSGTLEQLLAGSGDGENREDYLEVTLEDRGMVYDAMGQLRKVYPNVLHVRRAMTGGDGPAVAGEARARETIEETFAAFFKYVTDKPPSEEETEAFASVVEGHQ
ncbi:MAG TPA: exonuclease SbcCD subunit D [Phycisphaerae bacterium]|jgi:exonuclease SbcD|nr:exonuclease SbcCD subunit D [Phycisphaerae bacterium]HOB76103.1 exonuclease SbcCD subunit D [Phycisphaerae bacterium]HOJ56040.1 exonuclease SbcCD subunit D [Phycisphaerae bacterium]HOL27091.1 exonuclease SbcCD subunit D [Phycisphaerae bacterium]HPP21223.1 exonuclease SbcCD subunit D [Phycisphaerae bacterium]